jgi:hypothetical protein
MAYPLTQTEGYATRFQYGVIPGGRTLTGTADAIATVPGSPLYLISGNYWINSASADAITLALPLAGGGFGGGQGGVFPNVLGQDEFELSFVAMTAFAHIITTPTNGINGSTHIATFAAAVGNNITLRAKTGVWYVIGTPKGVTLT